MWCRSVLLKKTFHCKFRVNPQEKFVQASLRNALWSLLRENRFLDPQRCTAQKTMLNWYRTRLSPSASIEELHLKHRVSSLSIVLLIWWRFQVNVWFITKYYLTDVNLLHMIRRSVIFRQKITWFTSSTGFISWVCWILYGFSLRSFLKIKYVMVLFMPDAAKSFRMHVFLPDSRSSLRTALFSGVWTVFFGQICSCKDLQLLTHSSTLWRPHQCYSWTLHQVEMRLETYFGHCRLLCLDHRFHDEDSMLRRKLSWASCFCHLAKILELRKGRPQDFCQGRAFSISRGGKPSKNLIFCPF